MKKIRLEILGLSPSPSQQGSFALVLGEQMGNRRLPIIIGVFEAQAIAVQMESIIPNRPMTHDLFRSFADAMNYSVKEVIISDLKEGVFYANVVCGDEVTMAEIDARPSDAIAIALRFDAPIYTVEAVMSEAGIEANLEDEGDPEQQIRPIKQKPQSFTEQIKEHSIEELQKMLDEALQNEEYEKAAQLRDELGKRN